MPAEPRCPIYGECGGCQYQDLTYAEELQLKEQKVTDLLEPLNIPAQNLEPITASPMEYAYRNRLDLSLLKTKDGEVHIGFRAEGKFRLIPVEACDIARDSITQFMPQLRAEAIQKLPADYRIASLVVKTDDNGRIKWGGIGRKSLQLKEEDYLWTDINGMRIHFSLDTFFQVNSSILPAVFKKMRDWVDFTDESVFLDLYGGVGLFSLILAKDVKKAIIVEDNIHATRVASYNIKFHGLDNVEVHSTPVEKVLPELLNEYNAKKTIGMIDPPRKGLSTQALEFMVEAKQLDALFYLSCNPESLQRDLVGFIQAGWSVKKVGAFDFFPKTRHVETLVLLEYGSV
ncbi:MAG: tRNA/tmRNA/rRNA uracil-C5-methylase (TrmA/RlmC/RlmD family) [Candidatus Omnitrophota bacterium]|jgi:tRNA/tmRNA/rRNA uracil-C5-methylase (TrmA/RlmC/RlmD family)